MSFAPATCLEINCLILRSGQDAIFSGNSVYDWAILFMTVALSHACRKLFNLKHACGYLFCGFGIQI